MKCQSAHNKHLMSGWLAGFSVSRATLWARVEAAGSTPDSVLVEFKPSREDGR